MDPNQKMHKNYTQLNLTTYIKLQVQTRHKQEQR